MLIRQLESLVWLSRWYNGRAARLSRTHAEHTQQLEDLIRGKLGYNVFRYEQELTINGVTVIATCTPERVIIHGVGTAGRLMAEVSPQQLLFKEGPEHRGKVLRMRKLKLIIGKEARHGSTSH